MRRIKNITHITPAGEGRGQEGLVLEIGWEGWAKISLVSLSLSYSVSRLFSAHRAQSCSLQSAMVSGQEHVRKTGVARMQLRAGRWGWWWWLIPVDTRHLVLFIMCLLYIIDVSCWDSSIRCRRVSIVVQCQVDSRIYLERPRVIPDEINQLTIPQPCIVNQVVDYHSTLANSPRQTISALQIYRP